MRLPTAAELIDAWEQGAAQHWIDRALILLSAAYPEMTFAQLAGLSIGQRDARLLALHEQLFGSSLSCFALCPQCDTRQEFKVNLADMSPRSSEVETPFYEIISEGVSLKFRGPDSQDLAVAALSEDVVTARKVLLERCVLEAVREGALIPLNEWPPSTIDALAAELGKVESCADVSFAIVCIACAHRWQLGFDIVSFVWTEISWLAKRYLREVHTLAWAYGWREADILAMSPARRQFYLDSVS